MVKEEEVASLLLEARRRRWCRRLEAEDEELLMTEDGDDAGVEIAVEEEAMLLQGDDNDDDRGDLVDMGEKEEDEEGEAFWCGDEATEIMGSISGRPASEENFVDDSSFFPWSASRTATFSLAVIVLCSEIDLILSPLLLLLSRQLIQLSQIFQEECKKWEGCCGCLCCLILVVLG